MITPGTTPKHEFEFPVEINPSACEEFELIYAQCGRQVIVKHKADFVIDGQNATVSLTQDDTRAFSNCHDVEIEFWVKLGDGTVPDPYRFTETVDTVIGGAI